LHPNFSATPSKRGDNLLRQLAICYGYDDWYRDFTDKEGFKGGSEGHLEAKFALIWCNFKYFFKKNEEGAFLTGKKDDDDYNKPLDKCQLDFIEFLRDDVNDYMSPEQAAWATLLVRQKAGYSNMRPSKRLWGERLLTPCFYSHGSSWERKKRDSPEYQRMVSLFNDYKHPFLHAEMPI
jgi:hypothetical protein